MFESLYLFHPSLLAEVVVSPGEGEGAGQSSAGTRGAEK